MNAKKLKILKIPENTRMECFFRLHVKKQDYGIDIAVYLSEFHVA